MCDCIGDVYIRDGEEQTKACSKALETGMGKSKSKRAFFEGAETSKIKHLRVDQRQTWINQGNAIYATALPAASAAQSVMTRSSK